MSWHVRAGCVQCTGTWGDTHRSDRRGDIASSEVAANQHYSCCLSYLSWYLPLVVILLSLCEESPARPSDSSLTEDFWMWKLYWNNLEHVEQHIDKSLQNHEQKTRSATQTCISESWSRTNLREVRQGILLRSNFHWCASGPSGPFKTISRHVTSLWITWDIMRLNHKRLNQTESYRRKKTVVDGCNLFKILTPFDSATFRDWSHAMLPQLCLSNLEEMNGFSIGSIGSVPCCHIWVFSERNLTELRQTVLQWRSPWWGAALSNGIKLTWISHIRQLLLWHFVSFGVNWY